MHTLSIPIILALIWSVCQVCRSQDPSLVHLFEDSGSGIEDSGSGQEQTSKSGELTQTSGPSDSIVHVREGQKVRLECPFLIGQNAEVYWTKDYLSLIDGDRVRIRNARLTIRDARTSDSGFYMCVVYDTDGIRSKTYNIAVHSKPFVISPTEDSQITEGDTLKLPCVVDPRSNRGQLHQTWQRVGDLLPYGRFHLLPDGSLKIVDTQPSDSGTYECLVANRGGKAKAAVKVKVLRRRGRAKRDTIANCEGGFPHFASTFSYLIQNLGQSNRALANNTIFAPISIFKLLYMLYMGSSGATKEKFEVSLNFPPDIVQSVYDQFTKCLVQNAAGEGSQYFEIFNFLFHSDKFTIHPNYTDWLIANENIEIHSLKSIASNFEIINSEISNKTEGMIPSLVTPDLFDSLSKLVLLSVLYFKANWTYAFDPSRTKPGLFRSSRDNSYEVPMMQAGLTAKYARKDGFGECLELTYGGAKGAGGGEFTDPPSISLFLHLPAIDLYGNELEGTDTLSQPGIKLQTLYDFINREISSFHEIPMDVTLPKFSLDSGSFSTEAAIRGMGLGELFESPEFEGMSDERDLFVSDMLQRAAIKIGEQGTEAAAATIVHVKTRSRAGVRTPFNVDRPFSLILMHKPTMAPIMAASITDLRKFAIQPDPSVNDSNGTNDFGVDDIDLINVTQTEPYSQPSIPPPHKEVDSEGGVVIVLGNSEEGSGEGAKGEDEDATQPENEASKKHKPVLEQTAT